jgi:hypothetical protein
MRVCSTSFLPEPEQAAYENNGENNKGINHSFGGFP